MTRDYVFSEGFDLDSHFTGHGIGQFLHQFPHIQHHCTLNWLDSKDIPDVKLVPGMAFTIEPIVTMVSTKEMLSIGSDKFTIVSPGNPSAQWEHIILITETGCEVLTKRKGETITAN